MPLYLEPVDVSGELESFGSVLIVSCPVCPSVSLSMQKGSPFIDVLDRGIKTPAFEDYVQDIRNTLEQHGIRTGVFTTYVPCPTMCLWTPAQRKRLFRRARDYDAVLVLGCDSATFTAQQSLEACGCRVVQGMRVTGLTNATVSFRWPLAVHLEAKHRVGEQGNVIS